MKSKKHLFITAALVTAGFQLFAQANITAANTTFKTENKETSSLPTSEKESAEARNFTFVKINLAGIAVKNYSIQAERTINKKFSAAVSFRTMPNTAFPFRSQISNLLGDNSSNTKDLINNLEISNFAITPEVRMYLGKGYGRGFYIAPFYRYASFATNTLKVNFTGENGTPNSLNLSGTLHTNTAGILVGAQWAVGKSFCIDWWIAGPHYGAGKGNFIGASTKSLSQREQDELYKQINNLNIPFANKTVNVNAGGATMDLNGPWAGVRTGLSFGVKF